MNQPNTLDFDKADSMVATQDIIIDPKQLDGSVITLKFVKFQNVKNIQFFFKVNDTQRVQDINYFFFIPGQPRRRRSYSNRLSMCDRDTNRHYQHEGLQEGGWQEGGD